MTSWEKVRDVPKVTIDFGGGKVLKRTLKGNTVIYLCSADGRVIDAWPGVYMPASFLPQVQAAKDAAQRGDDSISKWHEGLALQTLVPDDRATLSKAVVEAPLLKVLGYAPAGPSAPQPTLIDPFGLRSGEVSKVQLQSAFSVLCQRVQDQSEHPMSPEAARAVGVGFRGDTFSPDEAGLASVRMDETQNQRVVRPLVHIWLAGLATRPTPSEGRDPMFKTLFHLPIEDPYVGLAGTHLPGTPNP